MFAVVGFGMNALEPIDPTMLMMTASGAGMVGSGIGTFGSGTGTGAGGSSNGRSWPLPPAAARAVTTDGEDGVLPALQLHIVSAQATNADAAAMLMRMLTFAEQAGCRAKL